WPLLLTQWSCCHAGSGTLTRGFWHADTRILRCRTHVSNGQKARVSGVKVACHRYLRIRSLSRSNRGVAAWAATVTGYRSPRYSTANCWPTTAWTGGRYAIRMCLESEGADDAEVTYARRP